MSTAITLPENALAQSNQEDFRELAKANDFLPQLRLVLSSSPLASDGTVRIGHYALVKSKSSAKDLGDQVSIYPIMYRPLGLYTKSDPPISCYDQKSDVFKDMVEKAKDKDSGYLTGPEFLVWLPSEATFARFFMSSKTMKNKAQELLDSCLKPTTLKSILITKGTYKWYGPVVTPCSLPLDPPDQAKLLETIEKFKNPPVTEVEVATTAGRADR